MVNFYRETAEVEAGRLRCERWPNCQVTNPDLLNGAYRLTPLISAPFSPTRMFPCCKC
jgi:hypothetical protein